MKAIARTIMVMAAALVIHALPVAADEINVAPGQQMDQGVMGQKDECLLVARNCGNDVDSLQERIQRLEGEISKGIDTYSYDELKRLTNQLDEYKNLLDLEMNNGGA